MTADGQPIGNIALSDKIRPEVCETLGRLRAMGVEKNAIVYGDGEASASQVAAELDLPEYHYCQKPEEKQALLLKEFVRHI